MAAKTFSEYMNEQHMDSQIWLQLEAVWEAATDAAEARFTSTNTGSPKLLDDMEHFAVMCDRAGNGKDARLVRSWVKQLRASA